MASTALPPTDLKAGTKSITLTLSSGAGSVPIAKDTGYIGVKPITSTDVRLGLDETPVADGTKTGAAAESDLKAGCPVQPDQWNWFYIGPSNNDRTLNVIGGASDVVKIARIPA